MSEGQAGSGARQTMPAVAAVVALARAALLVALLCAVPVKSQADGTQSCTADGGSDVCRCADTIVNCDFTSYTRVPFGLPGDVSWLSMYSGKVKALTFSSFSTPFILDDLVTVNFRDNVITNVDPAALPVLTRLETLNLAENQLADLENDVFAAQTQLQVLDLSNNRLASLRPDVFSTLTSLEELYLQGNRITALPRNLFSSLENLRILRLDGNSLTTLDDGVFDALTQLEELHIAVNTIHTIKEDTFDNLMSLTRLNMLGNPSSCTVQSGNINCLCNFGYDGDGTFCTPRDCGPTIANLNPLAEADCSASTIFGGDPCVARCMPGYSDNTAQFVCNADGEWDGELECPPVDCGVTIDSLPNHAVATCGGDTRFNGDPCMVSCEKGFTIFNSREESVPYTCGSDGDWRGEIICIEVDCGRSIANLDRNAGSTRCNPSTFGSTCQADCKSGYDGGPALFRCLEDGEWEGRLTCVGKECGREIPLALLPEKTTARCRGDSSFGGDNCQATCIPGYEGFPTTYRCSRSGVWQQLSASSICTRVQCPTSVPNLDPVFRTAACSGNNEFEQTCMATCQPGYVGAPVPFTCGADKEWSGNFTDACTLIDCGPTIQDADALNVTGVCTGDTRYTGDACTATCAPGYTGQPTTFQCGQNGKWQGQPRCQRIECGRPALLDSNVRLNCLDTVALGRGCRARCAVGSKMGTGFTCNADGQWEGFVSCVLPPTQNTTTTTTTTTTTSTTTQALSSASGSLESGAVVGVIIGVIAFVLLIVVVVLTLKFRSSMTNRTRPTSGPAPHLTKQGGNGAFVAETSMYANPSHASFRNHKAQADQYGIYARAAMTGAPPPRPIAPKPLGTESSSDSDIPRQRSVRKFDESLDIAT